MADLVNETGEGGLLELERLPVGVFESFKPFFRDFISSPTSSTGDLREAGVGEGLSTSGLSAEVAIEAGAEGWPLS